MGLVVPSSCADFRAPHRNAASGVDSFARLFERVFCPHPSLTVLFLKCPMSATNPANNSSNTHSWFTNLAPDITPSHAHSSASIVTLIASSIVLRHVIQIRGASRRQGHTLCNPARLALFASPRFCYLFTAHSPHPYLQISFHRPISPVQHRALYKKNHYVAMYKLPSGFILHLSAFLILFVCSRPLACVAVHTLACSYHQHSFAAFFHSFTVLTLRVYFLRSFWSFASSLSLLDWVEAEGHLQCSAGLAQFTNNRVFCPRLELSAVDVFFARCMICTTK